MSREMLKAYVEEKQILSINEVTKKFKISPPTVYKFIKDEGLERISKGTYAYPETWLDEMTILSNRSDIAVFSHESALYLHHLSDRESPALTVTVPSDYNASHLIKTGVRVFYIKPELMDLGKTEVYSSEGNLVPCYDLERTICDCLRSRSQIEKQTLLSALKSYVKRQDKRLDLLNLYAEELRVSRLLYQYLEVLL